MIEYNHLNLPEVVEMSGVQIEYNYLADGTKLANRVTKGEETTTRLYQNGMVFENGVLDHILTEEGKVVPFIPGNDELLDYQYFIKDHLGNVRSVVREQRIYEYIATMETENAEAEESQFSNIAETRQRDVAHSYSGDEFAITNNGQPIGPAFALNVTKGDKVSLSVHGKAVTGGGDEEIAGTDAVLAALVDAFTGGAIHLGENTSTISSGLMDGLGLLGFGASDNKEATGYLNYLLFDKNFTLVTGGFSPITASSYEKKTISEIAIEQPGYLIAYLSYESNAPDQMFFDDFGITLETSTVIQQDDYYPFGGRFNSWTGGDENKYLYNGKELQDETQWYDYGARIQDPWLGRFNSIDPHSDNYSNHTPYNYVFNNPINIIDPDGRDGVATIDKEKKTVEVSQTFHYSKSNAEVLKKALSNLNDGSMTIDEFMAGFDSNWGGESNTVEIDGQEYSVGYSATFVAHDDDASRDEAVAADPTSNSLIFDRDLGPAGQWNGKNRSVTINPLKIDNNTFSHEVGHSLGLGHNNRMIVNDPKGDETSGGIMTYATYTQVTPLDRSQTIKDAVQLSNTVKDTQVKVHIKGYWSKSHKNAPTILK